MPEIVTAGPLALALEWEDGRITEIGLRWSEGLAATPGPSETARAVGRTLERYVRGETVRWPDLPLALERVSRFTREILLTLVREAPQGMVVSYGELARLGGRPGAARAVGRAMAANRWPLILPCHRVLGARGALTGFSNPAGLAMKEFLLRLEGVL
ncbi:methylated-DNA--[protein]-cysteine S-methyltransferase [Desulfovibrio sp.]